MNPLHIVTPSDVNHSRLPEIASSLRELQSQMNDLFPEREALINQLIYGLLTREHVLVHGGFGTGKSRLVDQFFGAFTEAKFFSVELTKFMTESNIVGIPNPKILREEGRIFHEIHGTMLEAHFAELDELFDANDHLLRTLLGILNERRFNRGIQLEQARLHMALASTNADPELETKRSPTLGAVVDRFLFRTQVSYLTKDESRRQMYTKYVTRAKISVRIPFADVEAIANAVADTSVTNPLLLDLHNQIVQGFQKAKGEVFSDRRACQAIRLAQANALLHGRREVAPEDFLATMWAFCNGHDTSAQEKFRQVAKPLIEKAVSELQPDIVRDQMLLLEEMEGKIPALPKKNSTPPPTSDELVKIRRILVKIEEDVMGVKPSHPSIEDRQKSILATVEKRKVGVGKLIDGRGI